MVHVFIVNPYAGNRDFAGNLRNQIKEIKAEKNINGFVFNTRCAGAERSLAKDIMHIFEGERIRIYSCGGSGTFRNILNGITDFSNVELAFYPCGLTNDFLKAFEEDEKRFHDISELVDGDVINIDYIQTNYGRALNTLSLGVDSSMVNHLETFSSLRFISGKLAYGLSIGMSLLLPNNLHYDMTFDEHTFSNKVIQLYAGNGPALGGMLFMKNADVSDGKFEIRIGTIDVSGGRLKLMGLLSAGKYEKAQSGFVKYLCEEVTIQRSDEKPFVLNFDGELETIEERCHARMIKGGMQFVVPKGVKARKLTDN